MYYMFCLIVSFSYLLFFQFMHNFGEKRFGDGLVDDIRSQTEPNTRVVGDFTKVSY